MLFEISDLGTDDAESADKLFLWTCGKGPNLLNKPTES
jgi:hypothetical protein